MPRKSTPPPAAPVAASKATKSSAPKPKVAPPPAPTAISKFAAPATSKVPTRVVPPPAKKTPAKTQPTLPKKTAPVIEIGITEPVADERSIFCFENVQPSVDGGLFACKFEIGDTLEVSADIWMYGHEKYECWFEVRPELGSWTRHPLDKLENDRFGGSCVLDQVGLFELRVGGTWLKNGQESSSDAYDLVVDPVVARYGSWYTMWPLSLIHI